MRGSVVEAELASEAGIRAYMAAPPWAFLAGGSAEGKLRRLYVMGRMRDCLEVGTLKSSPNHVAGEGLPGGETACPKPVCLRGAQMLPLGVGRCLGIRWYRSFARYPEYLVAVAAF